MLFVLAFANECGRIIRQRSVFEEAVLEGEGGGGGEVGEGVLGDDEVAVLVVDLFPEELDEDAPGGPGVADLAPAHRAVLDLQQLLDDVAHAEDVEVPAAPRLHRPPQHVLVDHQQLVGVLAVPARLPVQHHHLLQVLLRVPLPPQPLRHPHQRLRLRPPQLPLPHLLPPVVLLQPPLLVLVAPLRDPVHEVPDRLEDDPVEDVGVDDFAEAGVGHLVQLQVHPHEGGVGLEEGPDLVEDDVVVLLADLPQPAPLLAAALARLPPLDPLPQHLLLEAEDEVLERAGQQAVRRKQLPQRVRELAVVLEQVRHLHLRVHAQPVHEHRLRQQQAAVLHSQSGGLQLREGGLLWVLADDLGEGEGVLGGGEEEGEVDVGVLRSVEDGVVHEGEALLLPHEVERAAGDGFLDPAGGHLVEVLLEARAAFRPQLAVHQQQLVELLSVALPDPSEVPPEVRIEPLEDLPPPLVLLLLEEGLEQLAQQLLHVPHSVFAGLALGLGRGHDHPVPLLEHQVDVLDGLQTAAPLALRVSRLALQHSHSSTYIRFIIASSITSAPPQPRPSPIRLPSCQRYTPLPNLPPLQPSIIQSSMSADHAQRFQALFFDYQVPVPLQSVYEEHFIKSNDLRLLLEIATHSTLRMFTDPKSGSLHFICKKKGAGCFDIEAEPHASGGYFFAYDYRETRHKGNCVQRNECLWYLTIYNLMKIKKELIREYMGRLGVEHESPSLILSKLSGSHDKYFFETYINGHLELKRKLRKKFDNVINIDIKKIGRDRQDDDPHEKENFGEDYPAKPPKRKKERENPKPTPKETGKSKKSKKISKKAKVVRSEARQPFADESACLGELSPRRKEVDLFEGESSIQMGVGRSFCNSGESLLYVESILPEIQALEEQAVYIWSDSEQEYSYEQAIKENAFNAFNYFQSVTNSALKLSLDQHSLQSTLFSANLDK